MKTKSPLLALFLVVLLDLIGFGIIIPLLPYYAQTFGATGSHIGWLMAAYSIAQFIFAPIWGRMSDLYGRRPVLLTSILGQALAMTATGFADSLILLFVARIFAGICAANISTAYAYVSDVTDDSNRAKGMGALGAAFGLGFVIGPAIGGVLSKWGYDFPMFVAAGLSTLNFLVAFQVLKETTTREQRLSQSQVKNLSAFGNILRSKAAFPILLFFLFVCALVQLEVVFAIFMKARFDYSAQDAGILLAAMGIIMIVIQGGMIGRLSKKYGEKKLVTVGLIACSIGLAGAGIFEPFFGVALSFFIFGIGHALVHPSLSAITSKTADPAKKGLTMGAFHSAGSLARALSPIAAGTLYDQISISTPFLFGAVLCILGLSLSVSKKR